LDKLEAKPNKNIIFVFMLAAIILAVISLWKGRIDGLIVAGIIFLIYVIARILIFYSKSTLIITNKEIKVKNFRTYKSYLISDYKEFRINPEFRFRTLLGYKEIDGELKEYIILGDIFDISLDGILMFIQSHMAIETSIEEWHIDENSKKLSDKIDNFHNKKYKRELFLSILVCVLIFPGISIGMYFQHAMSITTLTIVIVFSIVWISITYCFIKTQKVYLKYRRNIDFLMPLIYLITFFLFAFILIL